MAQPASSPSPRAQRTRGALIAAGMDLLADRPIDAIAIDELVARAGVAKGSFFNHFADKPTFADAIARVVREEVEELVGATNRGCDNPLERLTGGMIAAAQFARSNPRRAAVLLRATSHTAPGDHPVNRGLRADLDAAANAGLIDAAGAADAVPFWLACCQAVLGEAAQSPATANPAAAVAIMARFGLRGLGAPADEIDRICVPAAIALRMAG